MKAIIAIMAQAHGVAGSAFSSDYYNIYLPFKDLIEEVILFDYYNIFKREGSKKMNDRLLDEVKKNKPDLVFVVLHTDEFFPEIMDQIKERAVTYGFFHDDIWRQKYAYNWAPHFTYILSTDPKGEERYRAKGINNSIPFLQACNEKIYHDQQLAKKYDLTFVGAYHPYRKWLIKCLRRGGIEVKVFGSGWFNEEGEQSQEEMVRIFNQSRINLNLTNSTNWTLPYIFSSPRALINSVRSPKYRDGIKLRFFEISACRGFQLAYYEEGLERCFKLDLEIVVFNNPSELLRKAHYYLEHEEEREAIASRGYERTRQEHTMTKRLSKILEKLK